MPRITWTLVLRALMPLMLISVVTSPLGAERALALSSLTPPAPSGTFGESDDTVQPATVMPTIAALDSGAEALRPAIAKHLAEIVDLTGEQMGWRPAAPITVFVATEPDTAASTARSLGLSEVSARRGNSFGGYKFVVLNLVQYYQTTPSYIRTLLAHEWTHVAQQMLSGAQDTLPRWFLEGQAVYQEIRISPASSASRYLIQAFLDQRDGTALSLVNLDTITQWRLSDASGRRDSMYGRGYAAVRYLSERYGFNATVDLVRKTQQHERRFWEVLEDLTALTPSEFDAVVGRYLSSLSTQERSLRAEYTTVSYLSLPSVDAVTGRVDLSEDVPCASVTKGRVTPLQGQYLVPVDLASGMYAAQVTAGGYTRSDFGWRDADNTLSGVTFLDDSRTGCRSGPLVFGPSRTLVGTSDDGSIDLVARPSADGAQILVLATDERGTISKARGDAGVPSRALVAFQAVVGPNGHFEASHLLPNSSASTVSLRGNLAAGGTVELDVQRLTAGVSSGLTSWHATLR
jgi:hypothetical protein